MRRRGEESLQDGHVDNLVQLRGCEHAEMHYRELVDQLCKQIDQLLLFFFNKGLKVGPDTTYQGDYLRHEDAHILQILQEGKAPIRMSINKRASSIDPSMTPDDLKKLVSALERGLEQHKRIRLIAGPIERFNERISEVLGWPKRLENILRSH